MFFDPRQFAFSEVLQSNWRRIDAEYQGIIERAIDWFEKELYGDGWKVFGLFDFPHGAILADNAKRCPKTTELVVKHLPSHGAVGFSILAPRTRIQPHRGYAGNFLRGHLGLRIPNGDCALRVNGEIRKWETGNILIFDDRLPHDAWNETDEERVVLLFDFVPDDESLGGTL